MKHHGAKAFITESLAIESIFRDPTEAEIEEFHRFMNLKEVGVPDMVQFVHVYDPGERLRTKDGDNVMIGGRHAPRGGMHIRALLYDILEDANKEDAVGRVAMAQPIHVRYELLHPFTDCNGRSGRMLWAWMMGPMFHTRSFLHNFYYQTLAVAAMSK